MIKKCNKCNKKKNIQWNKKTCRECEQKQLIQELNYQLFTIEQQMRI